MISKRFTVTASLVFAFLIFLSCKNGANFIQNLEEDIVQTNSSYFSITINADPECTKSIVPVAGTYPDKYKIYDTISLYYTEKGNYDFSTWDVTPSDSVLFIDCEPTDNNVTLKIVKACDITIEAICVEKIDLTVSLSSPHAVVTPVEKRACVDETFTIDCREESNYYFVGWQVFNSEGEEITDYSDFLEIKEPQNQNTQVTVKKAGGAISLIPHLVERPRIVSSTPVYDANGVSRGSKIVLMFNKVIDESSIYYSEAEIADLVDKKYSLLIDIPRGGKCYGYVDNGNIVYKNIKICNYQDNSINYLKYFGAPYFDPNYPKILRISTNPDNLPPTAIDVLVSLSKEFFYIEEVSNLKVPLNSDFSFNYKTNASIDGYAPLMGAYNENETDFVVRVIPDAAATVYNHDWEQLASPDPYHYQSLLKPASTDIAKINVRTKKLWIRGIISDGDSGPSSVNWSVERVDCKLTDINDLTIYPITNGTSYNDGDVLCSFDENVETDVRVDKVLDLSNYNLLEGYYRLVIKVLDKSGNETSKDFYFVYDVTPLNLQKFFYTCVTKSNIKTKLNTDKIVDLCSFTVTKDNESAKTYTRIKDTKVLVDSYSHTNLGTSHNFVIKAKDYAGNESTLTLTECLKPGCIYYSDDTCSMNYYDFKTPIGIVTNLTTTKNPESSVQIIDLQDIGIGNYCWGKNVEDAYTSTDGWSNSDKAIKDTANNVYDGTIWYYLINTKNNGHTTLQSTDWYIPSTNELSQIKNVLSALKETGNLLSEKEYTVSIFAGNNDIVSSNTWGTSGNDAKTIHNYPVITGEGSGQSKNSNWCVYHLTAQRIPE